MNLHDSDFFSPTGRVHSKLRITAALPLHAGIKRPYFSRPGIVVPSLSLIAPHQPIHPSAPC